jgi:cyclopropane fatty-acyl-phospholipid synthase-like methyltransferase
VVADHAEIVRAGYDAMASRYSSWMDEVEGDPRLRFLGSLDRLLDDGSHVVDVGCGAGVPCAALLAQRHSVLGVDISGEQIRLAREQVPAARFERHDLATFELPDRSRDAVVALYSLIHVPRDRHGALLARFRRWLRPGGLLLATFTAGEVTDSVQEDFLGVPMFFSGFDAETNRRLVSDAGFALLLDEVVTVHEPEGPVPFLWVLAQAS